jgi:hypothetical protein
MSLNIVDVSARCCAADWMSTTGVSPVTVIVSLTAPTLRSAFTVAVKLILTSMASRFTVLKPVNVNVTS